MSQSPDHSQPASSGTSSTNTEVPQHPTAVDLVAALQELLAAERAGTKVATASLSQTQDLQYRALLERIRLGEADSCKRLSACLQHLGAEPTRQIGAFHDKAMAIAGLAERLAFIDRGQAWVIRRIAGLLPIFDDGFVSAELRAVLQTHERNSQVRSAPPACGNG